MTTHASDEQKIRERAYQIWERENRPAGRDHEHWLAAEREIAAEARPTGMKAAKKTSPKTPKRSSTAARARARS